MGNIIGGIAGGLLSKSGGKKLAKDLLASGDQAVEFLDPYAAPGAEASNAFAGAVGLGPVGGAEGFNNAFAQYLESPGYQFRLQEGIGAIEASNAARGMLNSGATLKGITRFGQDLAATGFENFLGNVDRVAQRGFGAATGQANAILGAGANAAAARAKGQSGFQAGIGQAVTGALDLL